MSRITSANNRGRLVTPSIASAYIPRCREGWDSKKVIKFKENYCPIDVKCRFPCEISYIKCGLNLVRAKYENSGANYFEESRYFALEIALKILDIQSS